MPTGERVAIKILEKARIKEVADAQRVAREIKILKRIRHPNVIQLFEVIDAPRQIFLVMEYLDGGELFDYIVKHQRIREDVAVRFFHDIVDGLSYLHRKEVAHRDLKPVRGHQSSRGVSLARVSSRFIPCRRTSSCSAAQTATASRLSILGFPTPSMGVVY